MPSPEVRKKISAADEILHWLTPPSWADEVLSNIPALLSDHAYLERKAASNALELLNRWPRPDSPSDWPEKLVGVARDEARHLEMVLRHISKRDGKMARLHKNSYASDLRRLVRTGQAQKELADRLLVSALIEARSCERFGLLAEACEDRDLAKFYRFLEVSESGHYAIFLELAGRVVPPSEVKIRWGEMLTEEARIIQAQPSGPILHGGVEGDSTV